MKQAEGGIPDLSIAIERRGALVDSHDQADRALQMLVGEAHSMAKPEVGTTGNFWWRPEGDFGVVLRMRPRQRSALSAR